MKNTLLLVFSIFLFNNSFGQIKFGINTSLLFCHGETVQPSVYGVSRTPTQKNLSAGIKIGLGIKYPISTSLIIMPELNLVNKGNKSTVKFSSLNYFQTIVTKYSLTFIELPLNIAYKGKKNESFIIGGGPVFSMGIGGSLKTTDGFTGLSAGIKNIKQSIKFDGNASTVIS